MKARKTFDHMELPKMEVSKSFEHEFSAAGFAPFLRGNFLSAQFQPKIQWFHEVNSKSNSLQKNKTLFLKIVDKPSLQIAAEHLNLEFAENTTLVCSGNFEIYNFLSDVLNIIQKKNIDKTTVSLVLHESFLSEIIFCKNSEQQFLNYKQTLIDCLAKLEKAQIKTIFCLSVSQNISADNSLALQVLLWKELVFSQQNKVRFSENNWVDFNWNFQASAFSFDIISKVRASRFLWSSFVESIGDCLNPENFKLNISIESLNSWSDNLVFSAASTFWTSAQKNFSNISDENWENYLQEIDFKNPIDVWAGSFSIEKQTAYLIEENSKILDKYLAQKTEKRSFYSFVQNQFQDFTKQDELFWGIWSEFNLEKKIF